MLKCCYFNQEGGCKREGVCYYSHTTDDKIPCHYGALCKAGHANCAFVESKKAGMTMCCEYKQGLCRKVNCVMGHFGTSETPCHRACLCGIHRDLIIGVGKQPLRIPPKHLRVYAPPQYQTPAHVLLPTEYQYVLVSMQYQMPMQYVMPVQYQMPVDVETNVIVSTVPVMGKEVKWESNAVLQWIQ